MKSGVSPGGSFATRAITQSTALFSTNRPRIRPTISSGRPSSRPKSTLMPTAMKNRPSSSPLNGSMSSSSSCRYSDSASITPARNEPSAIDRPTLSMSAAMPSTSSSAKPTKISRWPVLATTRSSGRRPKCPTAMSAAMITTARAATIQSMPAFVVPGASSASSSAIGITARSWNSSTEKASLP